MDVYTKIVKVFKGVNDCARHGQQVNAKTSALAVSHVYLKVLYVVTDSLTGVGIPALVEQEVVYDVNLFAFDYFNSATFWAVDAQVENSRWSYRLSLRGVLWNGLGVFNFDKNVVLSLLDQLADKGGPQSV